MIFEHFNDSLACFRNNLSNCLRWYPIQVLQTRVCFSCNYNFVKELTFSSECKYIQILSIVDYLLLKSAVLRQAFHQEVLLSAKPCLDV